MTSHIDFAITPIHRVKPDVRNARTHSKQQVEQIAASIAENGFVNPILINPAGVVIAGHGRLRAARKLGLSEVPTITITGLSEARSGDYASPTTRSRSTRAGTRIFCASSWPRSRPTGSI